MRRATSMALVTAVLALAPLVVAGPGVGVGPIAPQNGLVLHYAMETLAQGTVVDASASGLHGRTVSQTGTVSLATSLSGYGRAIALTGANHQYVDVPESPVLDVDRYTLSAWIRYTGISNDKTLGRWEILEKAAAYWMNVRTNAVVRVGGFYGGCTGSSVWKYLDSTSTVPVNRWTHVASTYDGTRLRIFINGRAAGSRLVSGRTCISGEPLAIGAKNNPAKGLLEAFWDGRLDDVRIYKRALSLSEIGQLATRP